MAILPNLQQELDALRAENAALKAQASAKLTLKVSEKGCLSIYGMGKWPISLYRGQIETILDNAPLIRAFIDRNAASLSVKA
jgi:hypothetical protein